MCSRFSPSFLLRGDEDVTLPLEDKVACVIGREELIKAQENLSYSFVFKFNQSVDCQTRSLCAEGAKRIMHIFHHEMHRLTDVFALERCTDWSWMRGICSTCVEHAQLRHKRGRRAVWKLLPQIFGFGSWEEIQKAEQHWNDDWS